MRIDKYTDPLQMMMMEAMELGRFHIILHAGLNCKDECQYAGAGDTGFDPLDSP
jgi:hypothetical protein